MTKVSALVLALLAVALLALPAAADHIDPYREALPKDVVKPVDVIAVPDRAVPAVDRVKVRVAEERVIVFGRQLPVTGGESTVGLLLLGAVLVTAGAGAVTLARRRQLHSPS